MQRAVRVVVIACALTLSAGVIRSVPAGAAGADVCSLVTRKEAGKILGAKVVKVERTTNADIDAQVCKYKTKKFTSKHLKKFNGALSLELIWGPLTQDLREAIDTAGSELTPIAGLGDEAYATAGAVFALRGEDVVQASILNWQAPTSKLSAKSEQAVRSALPRLPTG